MMYDELIKNLRGRSQFLLPHYGEETSYGSDLMKQAADAIEELSKQHEAQAQNIIALLNEKPRWIPVTERLPEEEESVFVVRKFLGIKGQVPPSTYTEIAYRIGDRWVADSDEYKIARNKHTDPLYWMPLPEPPKEET